MEKNEFKKVSIKYRTYHYFDDIIKFGNFDFHNTLLDERSYKNILIHDISYKTLIAAKLLHIRFDKIDEFIRVYDGSKYLVLFGPEKYYAISDRIRYLISQKNGTTYVISHNYAKIYIGSYDYLPLEETLFLHNLIIHIKSVFNKNQNH